MSTSINPPDFPGTGLIEELANRLFKNLPENPSPEADLSNQYNRYPPLETKGDVSDFHLENTKFPEPPYAAVQSPPSFGGAGISPGGMHAANSIDLRQQDQKINDPTPASVGNGQPSVAGSGISPSAHKQGNEVDLKNPQTSLPDPHASHSGDVPQSLAGSGSSPSVTRVKNQGAKAFSLDQALLPDLKNILTAIPSFNAVPQLPVNPPHPVGPSYYFINDSNSVPAHKPAAVVKSGYGHTKIPARPSFNADLIKKDFPILQETVNGKPLIWLDNAATTQKPKQVIDRLSYFYEHENSNIHRAAHELAARATDAYEGAREKVKTFLHAASVNEIVFVRGTTEAINLVAKSYGEQFLQPGDEVILSHLEHHANIVPWQQLAQKKGIKIKVIPVDDDGQIILSEYRKLLTGKTKLVSFSQVSNALGTVTPAKQIIDLAHSAGAKVLLDGAQSVSHLKVDLQDLKPDFFVFSGHKIFGPTGIGVLYGREDLLNSIQPWQGGGNMIKDVTFQYTQFHNAPTRFEAGTGNIADAVGLGAALDYVTKLGIENIHEYEHFLLLYATALMKEVPGLRLVGTAHEKASVLSFTLEGYKNDEVGKALNKEGVAVRTGNHCAQPILRRFGLESTVRPSLAFYNTCSDVDTLVAVLRQLKGA